MLDIIMLKIIKVLNKNQKKYKKEVDQICFIFIK